MTSHGDSGVNKSGRSAGGSSSPSVGSATASSGTGGSNWNIRGQSDPMVGPSTVQMVPGKLQMSASAEVHSRLAINLFRGRVANPAIGLRPITGLARFAQQSAHVWGEASRDDPAADYFLCKIQQAHDAAQTLIEACLKSVTGILEGMEGFTISLEESIKPVTLEMRFYSPWAWRGALLLKKFDDLVMAGLTALHLGLFTKEDWQLTIEKSATSLRHLFIQADGFVVTGLKRSQFDKGVKAAKKKYMEHKRPFPLLPREIISMEIRARLAPAVKSIELIEREERAIARQEEDKQRARARANLQAELPADAAPDSELKSRLAAGVPLFESHKAGSEGRASGKGSTGVTAPPNRLRKSVGETMAGGKGVETDQMGSVGIDHTAAEVTLAFQGMAPGVER